MIEQLEARVIVIVFDKFVTVILSEKDTIKAKSYGFRNADNRTTTHDYSIQFNSILYSHYSFYSEIKENNINLKENVMPVEIVSLQLKNMCVVAEVAKAFVSGTTTLKKEN